MSQSFGYVDLFAGIGGMRAALDSVGGECLLTCEIDKFAQQTYQANHGDEEILGDIRTLSATDVPDHDLLAAGFPCQPFSSAGIATRNALGIPHGFDCDKQGTMFGELVRIIEAKQPKILLLENVRNLVSHDKKRTFGVIRHSIEHDLGYRMFWCIASAAPWVPQNRLRMFMVCSKDNNASFSFDLPSDGGPTLSSILHPQDGTEPAEPPYTIGDSAQTNEKYTLSDKLWKFLQQHADKHRQAGNGFGYGLFGPEDVARTLVARYYKDGSEILIRQTNRNPRKLTPRECARLMGFDRPTGRAFVIPVSDTQAYKQFGNAVVVPLVAHIAQRIMEDIM